MAALSKQVLLDGTLAPTSAAAAYTNSSQLKVVINHAVATDQATGASTLSLWVVPSGGARANANRIVNVKPFTAAQSILVTEIIGLVLEPGDALHWVASTNATDIALFLTGTLFSNP